MGLPDPGRQGLLRDVQYFSWGQLIGVVDQDEAPAFPVDCVECHGSFASQVLRGRLDVGHWRTHLVSGELADVPVQPARFLSFRCPWQYAARPSARQVDILFSGPADRAAYLREGRADVVLLYAPFDHLTGLVAGTLHVEDRVAVLPERHRLATRKAIGMDELSGETFPRWPGVAGEGNGPLIAGVAGLVSLVRLGRVVAVLPRSLLSPVPPGIVTVPDAGPSSIAIARNAEDQCGQVSALIAAAVSLRPARCALERARPSPEASGGAGEQ